MPLYTVLAPPIRDGASAPDPVGFVFVKEGFCWPALFVPGLWLLYRRLWVAFLVYLAVALGLAAAGSAYGGPLPAIALAFVHLLFVLEANEIRRRNLLRRGYSFVGVVEGRRRDVEIRFFSDLERTAPLVPPPPQPAAVPPGDPPKAAPAQPSAEAGDVVGLFPAPGGAT